MVKYHRTKVYKEELFDIFDQKMAGEEQDDNIKDTVRSFENKIIADYVECTGSKTLKFKNDTHRNNSRVGLL